ncbi:hypothetical protein IQ247_09805 [Plectonema cf. radiosum LEGE 06105]|uniref:Uncharacterized protein n=1 Tax=Plectonema cf. radiosum LEGE 06105 TaxID=945769 RepID=A0A8J7EZD5_9CYAN|nr:hypothetical protein [Plectonema radiosum]MBE9212976.1 hypothetical protein [Plectonema cf. radiosum LEGE 06105]
MFAVFIAVKFDFYSLLEVGFLQKFFVTTDIYPKNPASPDLNLLSIQKLCSSRANIIEEILIARAPEGSDRNLTFTEIASTLFTVLSFNLD